MRPLRLAALALAALLLVAATPPAAVSGPTRPAVSTATEASTSDQPLLACLSYERDRFLAAVTNPPRYQVSGQLLAGMVPHHLVASDMIAGFFEAAARQEYRRVVVVSTSHFPQLCAGDVITGEAGWFTPHGILQGDEALPRALLADPLLDACRDLAALERDHGVAGLMPFVRYFLPEAQVSAVLLSNRLSPDRLEALIAVMEDQLAQGDTLLVASVDCSHYLSPEEAALRDQETARALEAFDYPAVARFGDANLDSPQTATLLLRLAQSRKLSLTRQDHSSSAEKLPQSLSNPVFDEGVTTYFVYTACRVG